MKNNPARSALGISFIGVGDIERSLEFYRDVIGLAVTDRRDWPTESLAAQWQSEPGLAAEAVLASYPGSRVGRVMLIEFQAEHRRR